MVISLNLYVIYVLDQYFFQYESNGNAYFVIWQSFKSVFYIFLVSFQYESNDNVHFLNRLI